MCVYACSVCSVAALLLAALLLRVVRSNTLLVRLSLPLSPIQHERERERNEKEKSVTSDLGLAEFLGQCKQANGLALPRYAAAAAAA